MLCNQCNQGSTEVLRLHEVSKRVLEDLQVSDLAGLVVHDSDGTVAGRRVPDAATSPLEEMPLLHSFLTRDGGGLHGLGDLVGEGGLGGLLRLLLLLAGRRGRVFEAACFARQFIYHPVHTREVTGVPSLLDHAQDELIAGLLRLRILGGTRQR